METLSDSCVEEDVEKRVDEAVEVSRQDDISAQHTVIVELSTEESYGIGPPTDEKSWGRITHYYCQING